MSPNCILLQNNIKIIFRRIAEYAVWDNSGCWFDFNGGRVYVVLLLNGILELSLRDKMVDGVYLSCAT